MYWHEPRIAKEDNFDYEFRVILLGDYGVRKSSILHRFAHGSMDETYNALGELGVKFKRIEIDNEIIKLDMRDTVGQERFRSLGVTYIRSAQGVLLVYDITKMDSFLNVDRWFNDVQVHTRQPAHVLLIGNKLDLEDKRVVQCSQGKELADNYGIPFLETSAINDTNVEQAFILLATMLKSRPEANPQSGNTVDTTSALNRGTTCC